MCAHVACTPTMVHVTVVRVQPLRIVKWRKKHMHEMSVEALHVQWYVYGCGVVRVQHSQRAAQGLIQRPAMASGSSASKRGSSEQFLQWP